MVMSELRWHTASPEDNKNSLKRDLLKSTPTSAREAAVHIMQNRCKLMSSKHVKNSLNSCSSNHKNSKKIYNKTNIPFWFLGVSLNAPKGVTST